MFSTHLLNALQTARHIAVLTGAGVSAESGVPTFRTADGLWKRFKPEELANFDAFMADPELVTAWYNERRRIINSVEPNPGHRALADIAHLVPAVTLITQNVDGLHQRAGSRDIIELHGNIHRNICSRCRIEVQLEMESEVLQPPCTSCGGLIRPDVVWFGEFLPEGAMAAAEKAALDCDIFFSIGTSALVYPAAALPATARQHGAYVVEINTERTALSDHVDECLIGPAGQLLPMLTDRLKENRTD